MWREGFSRATDARLKASRYVETKTAIVAERRSKGHEGRGGHGVHSYSVFQHPRGLFFSALDRLRRLCVSRLRVDRGYVARLCVDCRRVILLCVFLCGPLIFVFFPASV